MANRLSDDELRKTLQEYGEDVGPITPTTRALWEKKLLSLRKKNGPSPKSLSLNAFSSDDSEIESPVSNKVRKKRTSISRNESTERLSINRSREVSTSDTDIFKIPSPVHIPSSGQKTVAVKDLLSGQRSALHQHSRVRPRRSIGKTSAFDVETSDSDFDAESPSATNKSPRLRKKSPLTTPPGVLKVNVRNQANDSRFGNSLERKPLHFSWNKDNEPFHLSPIHNRLKRDTPEHSFRTNGYLSNTISNGDFHEEKLQGSSTNYSHCISWMLVIGAVIFFVVIGALYMTEVQKSSQTATKSYSKFCHGIDEEKCKTLVTISRELHRLLTSVAGEYECDTTGTIQNRNLTVGAAKHLLFDMLSADENIDSLEFYELFEESLKLFKNYPEWGIKCYHVQENTIEALIPKGDLADSSALEAIHAAKSLWCRLRHSLQWTTSKLLTLCFIAVLIFAAYCIFNFWKKRKEAQEKLFYEMVESVIDILQGSQDSSQHADGDHENFKAVVNIRDTVISPKDRKQKLWLWDKVVAFIEENESRVSVEYKKINGEDFKVWRWHPSSSEMEGSKKGKVWQGQAFNSLGKGKCAAYTPTPCLKIRNMFDPEVEYGAEWKVNILDAILEKCEGIEGIKHVAIDTSSSSEGCAYMLCSSPEVAGKAFNALHGWWFDGKLVTVKYIRLVRYLERFPDAKNSAEPPKPSNNMRLSLSTPFFSSALERS